MRSLRRTELRPVGPPDMAPLYEWLISSEVGDRWRYHGERPSFEQFVEQVWSGVLEQDMIVSRASGDRVGLVSAYNPDLRSGTCYVALVSAPTALGTGLAVEGFALFVTNLFLNWPFRKAHFEVFDYNEHLVRGVARRMRLEVRLADDLWWDGRYYDRYIFTADRDSWLATYEPLLTSAGRQRPLLDIRPD